MEDLCYRLDDPQGTGRFSNFGAEEISSGDVRLFFGAARMTRRSMSLESQIHAARSPENKLRWQTVETKTSVTSGCMMRHTDFVEMTAPLLLDHYSVTTRAFWFVPEPSDISQALTQLGSQVVNLGFATDSAAQLMLGSISVLHSVNELRIHESAQQSHNERSIHRIHFDFPTFQMKCFQSNRRLMLNIAEHITVFFLPAPRKDCTAPWWNLQ